MSWAVKLIVHLTPAVVRLSNSWIVIDSRGGPTDDKPEVIAAPPQSSHALTSILNIRVADVWSIYRNWHARGAEFLSEPRIWGERFVVTYETRRTPNRSWAINRPTRPAAMCCVMKSKLFGVRLQVGSSTFWNTTIPSAIGFPTTLQSSAPDKATRILSRRLAEISTGSFHGARCSPDPYL